jgi:hypothetical protein
LLYDDIKEALADEIPTSYDIDIELLEKISELKRLLFAAWLQPEKLLNQREDIRLEYLREGLEAIGKDMEVDIKNLTVQQIKEFAPDLYWAVKKDEPSENDLRDENLDDDEMKESILSAAKYSTIYG